jgi:hypothetical protein
MIACSWNKRHSLYVDFPSFVLASEGFIALLQAWQLPLLEPKITAPRRYTCKDTSRIHQ